MAHIYKTRVADTSLTTGTGPIGVSGIAPQINLRTFKDVMAIGDTAWCEVCNRSADEWEEGLYTYIGVNQLARTALLDSSTGGGPIDFSAGVKDVWLVHPARTSSEADDAALGDSGVGVLDFGALPGAPTASLNITGQSGITEASAVHAWIIAMESDDHPADEHWVAAPMIYAGNIVDGIGFTIYGISDLIARGHGVLPYGKYNVGWNWKG